MVKGDFFLCEDVVQAVKRCQYFLLFLRGNIVVGEMLDGGDHGYLIFFELVDHFWHGDNPIFVLVHLIEKELFLNVVHFGVDDVNKLIELLFRQLFVFFVP